MGIAEAGTIDELLAECEARGWECGLQPTRARAFPPESASRRYQASVVNAVGEAVLVSGPHPRVALHAAMQAMLRHHPATAAANSARGAAGVVGPRR